MIKKPSQISAPAVSAPKNSVPDPSRRCFLNNAGCAAIGGLVAVTGSSLLQDKKAHATAVPEAPPLPWKYVKLDPKEAGKRGYKNYLAKGG